jgi:hypothetical protein
MESVSAKFLGGRPMKKFRFHGAESAPNAERRTSNGSFNVAAPSLMG